MTTDVETRPSTNGSTPAPTELQTPDAKQTTPDAAQTTPKDEGTAVQDTRNERDEERKPLEQTTEADTPADSAEVPDEPRYSQKYVDAALEADREETRASERETISNAAKERRQQLSIFVQRDESGSAPIARLARQELSAEFILDGTPTTLPRQTVDRLVETVQAKVDLAIDGAAALSTKSWEDAINGILKTDAAQESFWKKARGLDPSLQAGEILPLLAEELVFSTKALRNADLETLLGHSTKAKRDHQKALEDAEQAGITKGLRSKVTGGDSSGGRSGGSGGATSYDEYMNMTAHQRRDLPQAEVARIIREEQQRKRGARR